MQLRSDRSPGLVVGERVVLPDDVELGSHVVIHDDTVIAAGVRIEDGAVVGKRPALGALSKAAREPPPPLEIGAGAVLCAGAVVVRGARIGAGAVIGDQAYVRERATIGTQSTVGRGSCIDNDVVIGARVRIQTDCYVAATTVVEDDTFLAPCVCTTNDNSAGRRPPGEPLRGPVIRRGARVGARAVLLPSVEIGEEAFVAAGAVVTRSVPPGTLVAGVPARPLRDLRPYAAS